MTVQKGLLLTLISLQLPVFLASAQKREVTVDELLSRGDIAMWNLSSGLEEARFEEPSIGLRVQEPVDPQPTPAPKMFRDGHLEIDETPAQHAHRLMESIRQGLYAASFFRPNLGLLMGKDQSREIWPTLKNIFCKTNAEARYYDLQGREQFCPLIENVRKK